MKWIFMSLLFLATSCILLKRAEKKTPSQQVITNSISGIWYIVSVNNQKVVKTKAGNETPFLDFSVSEKTLSGSTGCNRITGKATITNNSINFGPLATTLMMCPNAQYERLILQTLIGNLSYTYEQGIITITKEGRTIMTLAK